MKNERSRQTIWVPARQPGGALQHASFVCLSCAGNVECRSMIDRCPDDGKSDGDIYAGFNSEHLDGAMALVVIHGDHHIVVAALREEIGRAHVLNSSHANISYA